MILEAADWESHWMSLAFHSPPPKDSWQYNGIESAKSDDDAAEDTRVSSAAVSAQASAFPYKASRRLHARSAAGSL